MGKICVDGTKCDCPPKPATREGQAFSAEWDRIRQEKWEREHAGHPGAAEARLWGCLVKGAA